MNITFRMIALSGLWLSTMAFNTASYAADAIDQLQGHYSHPYRKGVPYGPDGDGKEHLIILKLSPVTAYIHADVAYMDYVFGIADLQDDGSLLYQEDLPEEGETETLPDGTIKQRIWPKAHHWCEFGIHPTKHGVVLSDPTDELNLKDGWSAGVCRVRYTASQKGMFDTVSFSKKDRRTISPKEIKAIQKSEEYQEALKRREEFLKAQQSPETAAPVPIK